MKRFAITARLAICWIDNFMKEQLREAHDWTAVASAAEGAERGGDRVTYDGVELDKRDDRLLIQDFLDHTEWY